MNFRTGSDVADLSFNEDVWLESFGRVFGKTSILSITAFSRKNGRRLAA